MPGRRCLRSALILATGGVAFLALATPALAANNDPSGANGTVKIDNLELDRGPGPGTDNDPHVPCAFAVNFFNFDKGQRADILFTAHQPTGSGEELLSRKDVLASSDPAGGAAPDPDESYKFSASDLGLGRYTPHPKQGYHVKLTVTLKGAPGAGKHKVFWIGPCAGIPTPSGATPGVTTSANPDNPAAGGDNGAGLPITGTAVGLIAGVGGALAAGGTALLMLRRRRKITWTA